MTTLWNRLGRKDAVNWVVIVVVGSLQFVASFVGTSFDMEGRVLLFALCSLASVASAVAVFMGGKHFLIQRFPRRFRPLVTVMVFQLGALTRAFVFEWLMAEMAFLAEPQILWRIYGSQQNLFVGAVVVASLVAMAREFSEKNHQLEDSLKRLKQTQLELEDLVKTRQDSLVASIRRQLSDGMAPVSGASPRSDAAHLQTLIDDVVRPISHQLGRVFDSGPTPTAPASRISWGRVFRHTFTTDVLHTRWIIAWFAVASFQFFSLASPDNPLGPYTVALVIFAAWLTANAWLWRSAPPSLPVAVRAVWIALIPITLPFFLNPLLDSMFRIGANSLTLVLTEALWFSLVTWTVLLVTSLANVLKDTNLALTDAQTQLRRQVVSDRVTARHVEEGIARVLHGPVQAAIQASVKRFLAVPEDTPLSPDALAKISQPINDALAMLDEPPLPTQPIAESLHHLEDLWSGVVDVTVTIDDDAKVVLDTSPTTSSILLELAREAVSNAIRHGEADTVTVNLNRLASGDIQLMITNNGSDFPDNPIAGIGTQLFQDMTLQYHREYRDGQLTILAVLPATFAH